MDFVFFTDEREDALRLLAADDLCAVIHELDNWLRGQIKYENRSEYQEVRDMLTHLLADHGVDLGKIYS